MLFAQEISEHIEGQWRQVIEAQQRSANVWQDAWQTPYNELASTYEHAVEVDTPEGWSALNDRARQLRETMAETDGGDESQLFVKLVKLTDGVDSALKQASYTPANLIPPERNELIERITQLERQVNEEQHRAILERELQQRLATALEELGKSKRAIQINVVNVDPASIIGLIRDAFEALKHGVDLLNDERFTGMLRKRALIAWLSAKRFVQATRRRFAALKRPWQRSATLDEFEGNEPDFHLDGSRGESEKRVALVIGNSAYREQPLKNPVNDAMAIGSALNRLGFIGAKPQLNLDYISLRRAVEVFARDAAGADMAVIFFSGHGIEVDMQNFLIPVDAKLERSQDLDRETVSLTQLLRSVEGARRLGLIIIDVNRNNPLSEGRLSGHSDDQLLTGQGLSPIQPSANTLVVYATKHGSFAFDGKGDNSPFTEALLNHIETPNLEVLQLFREVRDDVLERTRRKQEPQIYGTLGRNLIYLKTKPAN